MVEATSQAATEETPSLPRNLSSRSEPEQPSSCCQKCGERRWVLKSNGRGTQSWQCRACLTAYQRAWEGRRSGKIDSKHCEDCGQTLPHKHGRCPETGRLAFVRRGRAKLNERWPGYGDALTDEGWLEKIGHSWPRSAFPAPSFVFPGLDPSLDVRLIRTERDKDVTFCRAVAKVPSQEQREYLELALVDPADAARWAALPPYQRLIRKGDPDDQLIWKFFTMQRLNMNLAATGRPWDLASQGAQLPQMFGTIIRLSPAGVMRLCLMMNAFGAALQAGRPLGNVLRKPWDVGTI